MLTYTWRPAAFEEGMSHYTVDGQTPRAYGGIVPGTWVLAVCGQSSDPRRPEQTEATRCPRCRAWRIGRY